MNTTDRECSQTDFQDILITKRITDDFLRNQGLKKIWTVKYLWALGTGTVLTGFYAQWLVPSKTISPLSYLLAIGAVALIYFVYLILVAELTRHFPYAGGAYAFARRGLGNLAGYMAGTAGVFQFLFGAAALTRLFRDYVDFLMPGGSSIAMIGTITALLTVFYVMDTGIAARIQFFLTVCGLSGLILFIIGCTENPAVVPIFQESSLSTWQEFYIALPLVLWFYFGLENFALVAEETSGREKALPMAMIASAGTVVIFSLCLWFFAIRPMAGLFFQSHGYPLLFILQNIQSQDQVLLSTFAAVSFCAYIAALNGLINGFSRQIFSLARGGYYPFFLSRLSTSYRTPYLAVVFPVLLVLIIGVFISLEVLVYFSLIFGLLGHLLVLLSYYYIHKYEPALFRFRGFVNHPVILYAAFFLILMILLTVLYSCGLGTAGVFAIWVLAFLYYFLWARHHVRDEAPEESNAVSREKIMKIELN